MQGLHTSEASAVAEVERYGYSYNPAIDVWEHPTQEGVFVFIRKWGTEIYGLSQPRAPLAVATDPPSPVFDAIVPWESDDERTLYIPTE